MTRGRLVEEAHSQLVKLRTMADQLKSEIVRAEAGLEAIESRRNEILDKLRSLGLEPDAAEGEIQRLEEEVGEGLKELQSLLEELSRLVGGDKTVRN